MRSAACALPVLRYRGVCRRPLCAKCIAQPILGRAQTHELLLEGGGLFRDLKNLLLLQAVHLAQLRRLHFMYVQHGAGAQGKSCGKKRRQNQRPHAADEHVQRTP